MPAPNQFKDPDRAPHIAVSVDMLDTGVDIPEVVNLVFFKMVRSKTKFWQMIGRGTRLCENLFGLGVHKTHFRVFDFCQNIEFFNEDMAAAEGGAPRPLSALLFALRLDLAGELAGNEDRIHAGLRSGVISHLRKEVGGMSIDNFMVRARRRFVEKYQDGAPWADLHEGARRELDEQIAGLPSAFEDRSLDAKRFDFVMLRAELAVLRGGKGLAKPKRLIIEYVSALEALDTVPQVKKHMALIQEIQQDSWWRDVTAPILDEARRKLRGLMHLAEIRRQQPVYTDFEDEIGESEAADLRGAPAGVDTENFRKKAEQFLKPHEDHITILKLRRNEVLTPQDLAELEKIFTGAGAGPDEIEKVKNEQGGLGLFVRSLTGLDRAAAKKAFDGFIAERSLNADQIQFVNMIIEHLTAQGVMTPGRLYESPFTDIHSRGADGVFESADVTALRDILEDVRRRAAA